MKCLCVVCGVSALPWMDCRSVYLSWSPLPMLQILSLQQPSAISASLPGGVSAWWNRPATQQPLAHRTWEAFSPRVDVDMTQAGALHRFEKVWRRGWGGVASGAGGSRWPTAPGRHSRRSSIST